MRPSRQYWFALLALITAAPALLCGQGAAPTYPIRIDSTFDRFRDSAPKVYVRSSRLPTSTRGLYLRLVHERCARSMDGQTASHTVILEIDAPTVPRLVPLARSNSLSGAIEYVNATGHGRWENLDHSSVIAGRNGRSYVALAQTYSSEKYLRENILDIPGTTLRLLINEVPWTEFTIPGDTQEAVRTFLQATATADAVCGHPG